MIVTDELTRSPFSTTRSLQKVLVIDENPRMFLALIRHSAPKPFRRPSFCLLIMAVCFVRPTVADVLKPVSVQILMQNHEVSPGESSWSAAKFSIAEGWHIYWKNPGDTGRATQFDLPRLTGIEVGELQWPLPSRFISRDGTSSIGYTGTVLLLRRLTVAPDARVGKTIPILARLDWLACNDAECVPGKEAIPFSISTGGAQSGGSGQTEIEASLRELPQPFTPAGNRILEIRQIVSDRSLEIALDWDKPLRNVEWFPYQGGSQRSASAGLVSNGEHTILRLPAGSGKAMGGLLVGFSAQGERTGYSLELSLERNDMGGRWRQVQ